MKEHIAKLSCFLGRKPINPKDSSTVCDTSKRVESIDMDLSDTDRATDIAKNSFNDNSTWFQLSDEELKKKLEKMFAAYHPYLLNMISCRLNACARRLIDPNDILQEAFLVAWSQLSRKISYPKNSELIWLRLIVKQCLAKFHERYFSTRKRNIMNESAFQQIKQGYSNTSSFVFNLFGQLVPPSLPARREETSECVQHCLAELSNDDREILSLRHYEMLTNQEVAEELGVPQATASKRYLRALQKLKKIIEENGLEDFLK